MGGGWGQQWVGSALLSMLTFTNPVPQQSTITLKPSRDPVDKDSKKPSYAGSWSKMILDGLGWS